MSMGGWPRGPEPFTTIPSPFPAGLCGAMLREPQAAALGSR